MAERGKRLFIITCTCGNEVYGDEEDERQAWQCEGCGKWWDFFANEITAQQAQAQVARLPEYDTGEDDED